MYIKPTFLALTSYILSTSARPSSQKPPFLSFTGSATGVATFNDYKAQGHTVCGPLAANNPNYYGGAASDISPQISGGLCFATIDHSLCIANEQSPAPSYQGPACPTQNCGTCYKVTKIGSYGSSAKSPPPGAPSVIVQIIDSCPSVSAWNYCKTEVPANERCGIRGTNALDIYLRAYRALTGEDKTSDSPNLDILIEPFRC